MKNKRYRYLVKAINKDVYGETVTIERHVVASSRIEAIKAYKREGFFSDKNTKWDVRTLNEVNL